MTEQEVTWQDHMVMQWQQTGWCESSQSHDHVYTDCDGVMSAHVLVWWVPMWWCGKCICDAMMSAHVMVWYTQLFLREIPQICDVSFYYLRKGMHERGVALGEGLSTLWAVILERNLWNSDTVASNEMGGLKEAPPSWGAVSRSTL